ncbi:hypothetical protein ACFQ15_08155 [Sphingomonas hankookensis]|uniref:hypothetical protein n=1 Tax=Sphingomonas hankookensis TaxID=563996 RepID=UPI001F58D4E8|nr:hypothetical protein [Sphingomonas hankookensis]
MSALLRSATGIAALPVVHPVAPAPVVDPRDVLIETLRAEIASLAAAAETRVARASEDAARKACEAMQRDDAARTALLERALAGAKAAFDTRLEALDRLAPALARVVLDRLFAADQDRAALVEAMLARRLGEFRREAVVAIAVSAVDGLTDLDVALRHDPDLASGQCRIELRSEQLSLDLADEWAALAVTLDAMAAGV